MSIVVIVKIASVVIVGLVAFQLGIALLSSLRRLSHEKNQLRVSAELLQTKLETAKVKQFQEEGSALKWNGFRKFVLKRKIHEGKKQKKDAYVVDQSTNQEYELVKEETVLGRLQDSDIRLSHTSVSGTHARLVLKKKELFVEDLLSTNGTRINNEPVKPQTLVKLNHDDVLYIGEVPFKVQLPASQPVKPQGGDICSFYLVPHDGRPLPSFDPGQYLTFQFKVPGQSKPVIRCYSLSDSPSPEYYRISVKREFRKDGTPGLASNFLHDHVEEGDIIDVKSPGGKFFLDLNKTKPVVLIGGGIGLTPVLSMLNALIARKSKLEIWFFYGLRNGDEHIFKKYLENIALEHYNVRMNICYSRPKETDVKGRDYQYAERVSVDLFKRVLPSNNYDYYMCGPGPMMDSVVNGLKEWDVPSKDIYYEAFGPATVSSMKKPAQAESTGDTGESGPSYNVKFSKSDVTVKWSQSAGTILDIADENGVTIDSGCRAGNCHTCVIALKSGEVNYIGDIDSKPEDGTCLTCVTVPKSDIVIDA